ncbi:MULTISPECIES: DUF3562 domain-containing protein [Burkholderia]|uniref:DUF3562 domain-containing protein n=1 Tax=Burkholderia TaxID=32008 RepID=UPI000841851D|nr:MULTISPECIES: DUF3562 domain-containing protein [unclassified Burkholderia]AOK32630.1 hypothetical protein AQ611_21110 [Burkholderia sp. Bp7605]
MRDEGLIELLREAAADTSIPDEALQRWLDDEVARLEEGALIHDYVRVFAIRRLRERLAAVRKR